MGGTVPYKLVLGKRSNRVVTVGAGSYHSFAVDEHGDVWGWGLNTMGQAGTGLENPASDAEVLTPARVPALSASSIAPDRVVQIAGGEHHTVFLTQQGKVYACGRSDNGQLGLPSDHPAFSGDDFKDFVVTPTLVPWPEEDDANVVHISVGLHNNMAVTSRGALYAWGAGTQGELGLGADTDESATPTVIVRKEGGSWTAIATACGGQHTLGMFRKKAKKA